jgi:hypothetical protein
MANLWPRIIPRTAEEARALQGASFERRLKNLERQSAAQIQKASVSLSGSPLIGSITSSGATEVSGSGLEVSIPDTDAVVLCMLRATIDVTTAASADIRIGVFEATDLPFASKIALVSFDSNSTGAPDTIYTGYPFANQFITGAANSASSFRGPAYQNPYWRGEAGATPTAGLNNYRLHYWRESGTGTGEIHSIDWSVIVL